MNKKIIYFLIFLFILSFALRITYNSATVGLRENIVKKDAGQYHNIAKSIAAGQGYLLDGRQTKVVIPLSAKGEFYQFRQRLHRESGS